MNHLLPLFISILIAVVPASHSDGVNEQFVACSGTFNCGLLQEINYPFWANNISRPQFCGRQGFELHCPENTNPTIKMGSQSFQVLQINDSQRTINITIAGISEREWCSLLKETISIDYNLFSYTGNVQNLSLFFNCGGYSSSPGDKNRFSCPLEGFGFNFYKFDNDSLNDQFKFENLSSSCSRVVKVPVQLTPRNGEFLSEGKWQEALNGGFEVRYYEDDEELCAACSSSKGLCGSNQKNPTEFACLCLDEEEHPARTCSPPPPPTPGMSGHSFPIIFFSRI